jgi:hypothetical protein
MCVGRKGQQVHEHAWALSTITGLAGTIHASARIFAFSLKRLPTTRFHCTSHDIDAASYVRSSYSTYLSRLLQRSDATRPAACVNVIQPYHGDDNDSRERRGPCSSHAGSRTVCTLADTRACHMSHAKREIGFRQLRDARQDSAWAHALSRCDREGVRDGDISSWVCI